MRSHPAPPPGSLDRRSFLGRLAAASAALAISPPSTVLGAGAPPAGAAPGPAAPPPADERGVADLAGALALGETTSRALVEASLARIEALDARGPMVRAVIERNPDALEIADRLDQERKDGKMRGPLHGIPILIKDNIDSADRMKTSAGSLALADSTPLRDAFIVKRLRAAGAVLLGKTNLSEWANFRSSRSTSGWSGRGGQTRNPHVLDRSACGSSSGTGAALAAGYVPLGIGTETDGSIICPSSICGIVGIKPTLGLWSRSGIIPISASQDTAGPMTRSVADAAALLGPLAGPDPRDPATQASKGSVEDYSRFLDRGGLKGARIGVARNIAAGFHPDVDRAFTEALAALKDAGAVLVDPANLETLGKFDDAEFEVLLYEFKAGIAAYLEGLGPKAPAKSLDDLFAFNEKERAREMPFFGQETFEQAKKKGPLSDKAYRSARAKCVKLTRKEGIDATLEKHRLDALVQPSNGPSWPIDLINGDRYTGGNTSFAAVAGYPSITVPMGFVQDLPLGLSFIGAAWTEGKLIRLAYAFEQATQARRAPRFLLDDAEPALMAAVRKKSAAKKKAPARSPRGAKPARGAAQVLQFKITLEGIAPPIWRRIQIPASYTFWDLHVAIQDAMGWDDCHLHQFVFHGEDESSFVYLGIPDEEALEGEGNVLPGWRHGVFDQLDRPGDCVIYEYDFGDGWEHSILLETILPPVRGGRYPTCVAGERACPPEDCGGVGGYERLLEALRDPKHEDHEELLAWVGASYDPEAFTPGQVKFHDPRRRLKAMLEAD